MPWQGSEVLRGGVRSRLDSWRQQCTVRMTHSSADVHEPTTRRAAPAAALLQLLASSPRMVGVCRIHAARTGMPSPVYSLIFTTYKTPQRTRP